MANGKLNMDSEDIAIQNVVHFCKTVYDRMQEIYRLTAENLK